MNIIGNNPVTTEDINIAEQIFGSDIGALKGKTVRKTPRQVIDGTIDIPNELIQSQQNVKLCIDIMYVNGMQFLTTISKNIHYRMAQYVASKLPSEYAKALKEVINIYKQGGFKVTHIFCNNEFRPLMHLLADQEPEIKFNYSSPNEHVPDVERSIQVIKERIRATYFQRQLITIQTDENLNSINDDSSEEENDDDNSSDASNNYNGDDEEYSIDNSEPDNSPNNEHGTDASNDPKVTMTRSGRIS